MSDKALIGSVVERKTSASSNPPRHSGQYSGFPVAHHRSKSAFARNREKSNNHGASRLRGPPNVSSTGAQVLFAQPPVPDIWREQVGEENKRKVETMTEEEIKEEKRQIFERFGPEIGSILKRAKEARERAAKETAARLIPAPIDRDASAPPDKSISRPPSRVRFAELQPQDVYVYQSAPPSPRRKPIALPPPPANDNSIISLGLFTDKSSKPATAPATDEATEGTPEYIRRHYFPDAPVDDPNLTWLKPPLEAGKEHSSTLRFDLSGNPIPPEMSSTLPTHLGLHHHAEGYHAGYTLDDIFLLSRSSVPSQRATMLGVLARIAKKVPGMRDGATAGLEDFIGKEEELRKRMLAAGLEAINVRGSVGVRAVELAWTCIVNWDEDLLDILNVELQSESDQALSSIPLDQFLSQVAMIYAQGDALSESLIQLLAILHRLARQNNEVARTIVMTPKLISNLVKTHLLTHIPPQDPASYPEPAALELLITLALASRSNAEGLIECADSLLRFVTFLPTESPFPMPLSVSLLTSTLRFYATLGTYGLYAHVASTAMTHLMGLEQFIVSPKCSYRKLCVAWANLLSVWMLCAVDPHRTTPPHEILWSQITSFGWHAAALDLTHNLDVHEHDREAWGAIWRTETAWLTGCRVNAIKAGQEERTICSARVKDGFASGQEKHIMEVTLDGFRQRLIVLGTMSFDSEWRQSVKALNGHADILAAAINFWVSCTPLSERLLSAPPFFLPFSKISDLCEQLVRHVLWQSAFNSSSYAFALVRPLSSLLIAYLGLSKRLPGTTQDLWMAQALSIMTRLLPSHEEFALDILEELFQILNVEWLQSKGYREASLPVDMNLLKPFLSYAIRPNQNINVGPSPPTVKSIALATTQRLPSAIRLREFGLPLKRDWLLSPLDHILRSGSSPVFQALPASWNGSELGVVQATLLFTLATRDVLVNYGLSEFSLCREEAVFSCMKIFMLEHEQPQTDSSVEVFRNATVTQLMDNLLEPFTFGIASVESSDSGEKEDLESIASRFLGSSMPFFQYYTDFVALYDAISFAHPVFARLLLPPLSMRYALDYRKHLWDDFGHVVKTIRTPLDQVVTADVREYLFPQENSKPILRSYVRALVNDTAQEFLQLVAVHHVACNIWTDLGEASTAIDEDLSVSLLKAVIEQGKEEIARKVVTYRQTREGTLILPPSCYEENVTIREVRLASLKQQRGGERLVERVERHFCVA
ncbi:hypothetical protein APHAL10511_002629 [Amanita phalloides]|nr:hypothetical protein APHAL10511_002629 [Amanita phalloides]